VARYRILPGVPAPGGATVVTNGVAQRLENSGTDVWIERKEANPGVHKNSQVEGPVSDAFRNRFLLVVGTGGARGESEMAAQVTRRIREDWRANYFTDCPSKQDLQVSEREAASSNIIVVGRVNPRSALRGIGERAVTSNGNSIRLRDRRFEGSRLAWVVLSPNPFSAERYMVEINAVGGPVTPIARNLALYGWFDWVVWDAADGGRIVGIGEFDESWRSALPSLQMEPARSE
jgi:hypothetical protein